ncbi:MAG TPA: AmmeMemoRadiSam system protein B [Polyangia bacterium]|jgi:hypothetical protein|nr:AmmeMemoRadiSam system protein B [Polyangia bacterium]
MTRDAIREPAVAGVFYPGNGAAIATEIAHLMPPAASPVTAVAAVCPHAGWRYSGALAANLLGGLTVPERVLVLAPNHTGRGARGSVWARGGWRLPGGMIPVDEPLCQALREESALLQADQDAHLDEHAIEVLLPLLAARQPRLRLGPVVLGGLSFPECEELGAAIARAVTRVPGPTLIVASSDMNHYLPDDETRALDQLALAPLTAMDARGLFQAVRTHGITMCGYLPVTVALIAARALGATTARLVGYATSADAGGDRDRVVGYAAVRIS